MAKEQEEKVFHKTSINWYPGHMAKTKRLIKENLNLIDIVFEVIDARMPYSSKIRDIDNYIGNKPKVIIMTKIDLCDLNETKKWISYYENKGYKVLPLSLIDNQNVASKITNITKDILKEINDKRKVKGMKERKTRGLVVGIPNAGKSTLINRLAGKKKVNVGNKPGITKNLDWIRINDSLELLDSPGILWPKFEERSVAFNLASLTAIKEEVLPIEEVVTYILEMLTTYYKEEALKKYGIDKLDEDIIETFEKIGKKRGCLIKGGEIDYEKVYNIILNDIKNGSINGITFDRYNLLGGENE